MHSHGVFFRLASFCLGTFKPYANESFIGMLCPVLGLDRHESPQAQVAKRGRRAVGYLPRRTQLLGLSDILQHFRIQVHCGSLLVEARPKASAKRRRCDGRCLAVGFKQNAPEIQGLESAVDLSSVCELVPSDFCCKAKKISLQEGQTAQNHGVAHPFLLAHPIWACPMWRSEELQTAAGTRQSDVSGRKRSES